MNNNAIVMPFFVSLERLLALERAAQAWDQTPFRHNSAVRGQGSNCIGAAAGVIVDAGFAVPEFPLKGPTNWCKHQSESLQEKWLDEHPDYFEPICKNAENNLQICMALQPGDVVGFKVGLCVHHLGIILEHRRFFQCAESMGARAVILSQSERMFIKRLTRAWRPIEALSVTKSAGSAG